MCRLILYQITRGVSRKLFERAGPSRRTPEDVERFFFNCTGRKLGDPFPPEELVDVDEFFENPDAFQ